MPLIALLSHAEDAGPDVARALPDGIAAACRDFLAALDVRHVVVAPTAAAEHLARLVTGRTAAVVADLRAPAGAGLLDVCPADDASVVVADADTLALVLAEVVGLPADQAVRVRPDAGAVSMVRRAGDELSLAMFNVLPADPLREERTAPADGSPVEQRLHLLRHAETDTMTPDGRVFSHAPLPLTARGRRQAASLHERFAGVHAGAVHASDIARAAETAACVAGHGREVLLQEGLREIPLGDMEGAHASEVFAAATGFLAEPDAALPGGESFREVGDRAMSALERILASSPDGDVVVVAHGGVNRALLGRLLELPIERALRIRQDWACVNVLDRTGGRWWPRTINWTPMGLAELEHARRAAVVQQGPTALGAHVIDWRTN